MICYQLWIDDIRKPPEEGYTWIKDINEALRFIRWNKTNIYLIDIDHDAGDYRRGGTEDYIVILKELQRLAHMNSTEGMAWRVLLRDQIQFRLHSANPVGVQNMRNIIQNNGWKEIMW